MQIHELTPYTRERKQAATFQQAILGFIEVGQKLDSSLSQRANSEKDNYNEEFDKLQADREEQLIIGLLEDTAQILGLKVYRVRERQKRLNG